MRGRRDPQMSMLAFVDLEARVPSGHPLRTIKRLADEPWPSCRRCSTACTRRAAAVDPARAAAQGWLLIALYSVRSERAFCEELDYHLLFRWFLDMDLLEPSFDPTTFTKNRQRLLRARRRAAVLRRGGRARPTRSGCCRDEHFTVDGTLIEAAASLKSFRPKDAEPPRRAAADDPGNPTVNFHGERRSNATHQSTTDPEARLVQEGQGQGGASWRSWAMR